MSVTAKSAMPSTTRRTKLMRTAPRLRGSSVSAAGGAVAAAGLDRAVRAATAATRALAGGAAAGAPSRWS
jgi:hypothetical protein